jgi:DeoR family fructose operon transcriptional repressor
MLAEERYARICELVTTQGTVTAQELCDRLDASPSTIRRDLEHLDAEGRVARVHGGAASVQGRLSTRDQAMSDKYGMNADEKTGIARLAASLVEPDDFVFVDAGTSTERLVDYLTETRATFVTNSIPHARKLALKGCRTIMLGGELKADTEALVGPTALNAVAQYHFTKGFWGTNGFTADDGFTTPDVNEAMVKRLSMAHTAACYVLCDASKLGCVAPVTFADAADATVITDSSADPRYLRLKNVMEAAL